MPHPPMSCRRFAFALVMALVVAPSSSALAQVRASERALTTQTIDGAVVTISYARPRVRGRDSLFTKVVRIGETWTPGANNATTLDVSRAVKLDGHDVPKGRYSVWFVIGAEHWTMVLDPKFDVYHTEAPDSNARQIRWRVTPTDAPSTEFLTWSFPEVRYNGAQLVMQWGPKRVALDLTVTPRYPLTMSESDAKPFIGRYRVVWDEKPVRYDTLELYYEAGALRERYLTPPAFYPRLQNSLMSATGPKQLIPAIVRDGVIWEMVADMVYNFAIAGGRASGFTLVTDTGELQARGTRIAMP